MRLVVLLTAGALALGALSACTESDADNVNGDAPPSIGPRVVQPTPVPAASPKHRKKKTASPKPAAPPTPAVPPTSQPAPSLPPGEEFDPEHYDPEGDHDPAAPTAATPGP